MAPRPLPLNRSMPKPEEYSARNITRAKAGIVFATLFFLALILFGEIAPLGDFMPTNGITRTGVDKYRIHILSTPGLDKVLSKETDLNVTAKVENFRSDSRLCRLNGGYDFYSYRKLTPEWEFVEEEPEQNWAPLQYSLTTNEEKKELLLSKNNLEGKVISGNSTALLEKAKSLSVIPLKVDKYLLIFEGEKPMESAYFIRDPEKPELEEVNFKTPVEELYFDKEGSRVFARTRDNEGTGINTSTYPYRISAIDLEEKPLALKALNLPLSKEATVSYNAKADALSILDPEKLRIVEASSGQVRKILYIDKLLKEKEPTTNMVSISGVPALFLNDKLIDLRDGSIVDSLPGFSRKSIRVVDFKNKYLYYSPTNKEGETSMDIAIYDLHNLSLEKQIQLGTKNSIEAERKERQDSLKYLFIDDQGYLIALSAPA